MTRPLVAIVGRPNVGKSTLFNRIVGRRQAIVDNHPGVTRDRQYATAEWNGRTFAVVDTGGIELVGAADLGAKVRRQAETALGEADAVLVVMDAHEGLTAADEDLARLLRPSRKQVYYLANKVDGPAREGTAFDFYRLGVERVYAVSAEHGHGLAELLDDVTAALPVDSGEEETAGVPRLALVGRPNVGKSSLVNALLGEERSVVDTVPGTTRDAVDTAVCIDGRGWVIIDTAGIRRRGKVGRTLERYSVLRAKKSIDRADVCCLVMDASEMVTDQDAHIGGAIVEARTACVIVVNKWDLVTLGPRAGDEYLRRVREGLKHLSWAPVLFTSALTGRGAGRIFDTALAAWHQYRRRIGTPDLNTFFRRAVNRYKPPTYKGKAIAMGYITQEKASPPTFAVLVNDPARVHFSYRRYLENALRDEFGFQGTAIALRFKKK